MGWEVDLEVVTEVELGVDLMTIDFEDAERWSEGKAYGS